MQPLRRRRREAAQADVRLLADAGEVEAAAAVASQAEAAAAERQRLTGELAAAREEIEAARAEARLAEQDRDAHAADAVVLRDKVSSLLGVTKVTQAKLPPPRTRASVAASVDLD